MLTHSKAYSFLVNRYLSRSLSLDAHQTGINIPSPCDMAEHTEVSLLPHRDTETCWFQINLNALDVLSWCDVGHKSPLRHIPYYLCPRVVSLLSFPFSSMPKGGRERHIWHKSTHFCVNSSMLLGMPYLLAVIAQAAQGCTSCWAPGTASLVHCPLSLPAATSAAVGCIQQQTQSHQGWPDLIEQAHTSECWKLTEHFFNLRRKSSGKKIDDSSGCEEKGGMVRRLN